MSAAGSPGAIAAPAPAPAAAPRAAAHFLDVMRAELCKLRSVRSTYWALLALLAFNIVIAGLLGAFLPGELSAHERLTLDTARVSLGGIHLSQVAIALLGVLAITSEYSTGTIRATLAAVPGRRQMLAAKAVVFAATALPVATLSCFGAYLAFQAFVPADLRGSLGDPGVARALIGGGLYLTTLGLFGLGLGAVMRSSAGAVATLLAVLFVPPILLQLLPHSVNRSVAPYVPMEAGSAVFSLHRDSAALQPWVGFGLFCAYAAIALACAFVLIAKRDA